MEVFTPSKVQGLLYKVGNKGRQDKWHVSGNWYKADHAYEGLAEVIASDMLKKSNIDCFFDCKPVGIAIGNAIHSGCISPNGLMKNERLVTAYDLLNAAGSPYAKRIDNITEWSTPTESMRTFVEEIEKYTGIENFGQYLTKMLEFDAILLNDDRHMSNICVIRDKENQTYSPGPVFDHGHAFGLWRARLIRPVEQLKEETESVPFSRSFDAQMHVAEKLYGGQQLKLTYSAEDLEKSLRKCEEYYQQDVINYVKDVALIQMDQYRDYFYGKEREIWERQILNEFPEMTREDGDELILALKNGARFHVKPTGSVDILGKGEVSLYEICETYGQDTLEKYKAVSETAYAYAGKSFVCNQNKDSVHHDSRQLKGGYNVDRFT